MVGQMLSSLVAESIVRGGGGGGEKEEEAEDEEEALEVPKVLRG